MAKGKHKKKSHAVYKSEGREAKNKKRNIATTEHRKEKDATKFARRAAERGVPEESLRHPKKWREAHEVDVETRAS